jgi:hypothetical protein
MESNLMGMVLVGIGRKRAAALLIIRGRRRK